MRISDARFNCTARQVSSTSELVMPKWRKRASGPICSAAQVRKAMTSCFTTPSIASIAATSIAGFVSHQSQTAFAASFGTAPKSAIASSACASISNQMRYFASGSQSAFISARA